jgi:hypothetical protein
VAQTLRLKCLHNGHFMSELVSGRTNLSGSRALTG